MPELTRGAQRIQEVASELFYLRGLRDRLIELVRVDCHDAGDPKRLAEHLFLRLEGAIAHRGIDGDKPLLMTA